MLGAVALGWTAPGQGYISLDLVSFAVGMYDSPTPSATEYAQPTPSASHYDSPTPS